MGGKLWTWAQVGSAGREGLEGRAEQKCHWWERRAKREGFKEIFSVLRCKSLFTQDLPSFSRLAAGAFPLSLAPPGTVAGLRAPSFTWKAWEMWARLFCVAAEGEEPCTSLTHLLCRKLACSQEETSRIF